MQLFKRCTHCVPLRSLFMLWLGVTAFASCRSLWLSYPFLLYSPFTLPHFVNLDKLDKETLTFGNLVLFPLSFQIDTLISERHKFILLQFINKDKQVTSSKLVFIPLDEPHNQALCTRVIITNHSRKDMSYSSKAYHSHLLNAVSVCLRQNLIKV